jgi:hypothetical protein
MKLPLALMFVALALPLTAAPVPVPAGLLTAATTTTDASGQSWVYLRWQSTDGSLPFGTPFAVYLKNGAADSPEPLVSQGIAMPADKTAIASVILSRAAAIGADPVAVNGAISNYYDVVRNDHFVPDVATDLPSDCTEIPERLAKIVQQARGDARSVESLRQLALAQPVFALATAEAWAGRVTAPVGSPVTIELRTWDPATSTETGVAGRITVNVGTPELILAPGAPVQVPDLTATGERVVKLRFATSDDLRRQGPILSGYSLHRVTRAEAEARSWHVAPPAMAELRALAAGSPLIAKNLTPGPLLIGKLFSDLTVADFSDTPSGDPVTHYFADDNGRYSLDAQGNVTGTAFPDGAQFYYFAAGRDLLGRDGLVSPGGLATAVARLSPPVPVEVTLTPETYDLAGSPAQGFRLRWKANLPEGDNDTDRYEVFRGSHNVDLNDPNTLPAPVEIAHAPDADGYMSWLDTSLPVNPAETSTWWYTLRAVHDSPQPPDNRSGLTPVIYGSLQADSAPLPPAAVPAMACPLAGLAVDATAGLADYEMITLAADDPGNEGQRRVRLVIATPDHGVDTVEIKWSWFVGINSEVTEQEFTSFEVPRDTDQVVMDFMVPAIPPTEGTPVITFTARAVSTAGATSGEVVRGFSVADVTTAEGAWNQNQALVIRGTALAPGLAELRRSNALHVAMFGLSTPVTLNGGAGPTPAGPSSFAATVQFDDHTPLVLESQRNGVWETFTGTEAMGGRISFTDPVADPPAEDYRAYLVQTGSSPCIHFADRADGGITPVSLLLTLPPNYGEYRIYRRVDEGALELIAQGDGSELPPLATVVQRHDNALPATASRLAYFGQTFDKQGVASGLVPLGETITLGRARVETPVLKVPRPAGSSLEPSVRLEWFCPPDGIERFAVTLTRIGEVPGGSTPSLPPGGPIAGGPFGKGTLIGGASEAAAYEVKAAPGFTPAINRELGEGPVFVYERRVVKDTRYKISVQAISIAGVSSPPSREFEFAWRTPQAPPPVAQEPTVSWPIRHLPPVGKWHPFVKAELTGSLGGPQLGPGNTLLSPGTSSDYPVGVRIGTLGGLGRSDETEDPPGSGHIVAEIPFNLLFEKRGPNPMNYLYRRGDWKEGTDLEMANSFPMFLTEGFLKPAAPGSLSQPGEMLLPAVLYRQQVPSAKWPVVSGETIQVSPMIEKIAYNVTPPLVGRPFGEWMALRDPHVGLVHRISPLGESYGQWMDLFLLDTQPVVRGAKYRYTLLRFHAGTGEIAEAIDCGELLIPENL